MVFTLLFIGLISICDNVQSLEASAPLEDSTDDQIFIDGNGDFQTQAASNGWAGDGTVMNPYLIADLVIQCDANVMAIEIRNTSAFFQISNCSISPIDQQTVVWGSYSTGVRLINVTNGRLSHITVSGFVYGIEMNECCDVTVDNTTLYGSMGNDVLVHSSSHLVFENNTITNSGGSGLAIRLSNDSVIQCNNVSYNGYDGLDLDFSTMDSLIRWNIASRNGWLGGGHALYIAGTGNRIYGNILVSPGGVDSMPAGCGYGSINDWNSSDGVGNYYGANYDVGSGTYTSFLGEPLCSLTDDNNDGISDELFTIKCYSQPYEGGPEVDQYPLIYPIGSPRNLTATANSENVILDWEEPPFLTYPFGHYTIVRDDGGSTIEINVTETSYDDTVMDVGNWTLINYTVKWVSRSLISHPSNMAVGQNPDRPSVTITSDLGVNEIMIGSTIAYSNETLDPRIVTVEWVGVDSDSTTMNYEVKLDDGAWLENGYATNRTFTNLTEGNHTVTVRATDNNLNQAEDSKIFSVFRCIKMSLSCFPCTEGENSTLLLIGDARDSITGETVSNLSIGVAYSIQRGQSWAFTSAITGEDGQFQVSIELDTEAIMGIVLTTNMVDQYSEDHYFFENATYAAVTLHGRDGVFLAKSTSTISDFIYSSNMMKFNVSGESGTEGSTSILIPKEAVDETGSVKILIDGVQQNYTIASNDDYWVLTVNYTHSTHEITVDIAPSGFLGTNSAETMLFIALAAIGVVVVFGIVLIRRRRRR